MRKVPTHLKIIPYELVDDSNNILELLSHPNRIAQAVYLIVILAIVGLVFIIRVIESVRNARKDVLLHKSPQKRVSYLFREGPKTEI